MHCGHKKSGRQGLPIRCDQSVPRTSHAREGLSMKAFVVCLFVCFAQTKLKARMEHVGRIRSTASAGCLRLWGSEVTVYGLRGNPSAKMQIGHQVIAKLCS